MMYATSCRYPAPGLIVATPPRRASSPLLYDTEYLPTEAVRFFTGTWAFQHCGSNGNNGKQTGVHTNVFGFGAVAKDETFHLHGVRIWSDDESVRRALATHYAIHVGNGQHRFATTHAGAALFAPNSGTFFPITAEMARDALHGGEGDGPAIVTGGRDEDRLTPGRGRGSRRGAPPPTEDATQPLRQPAHDRLSRSFSAWLPQRKCARSTQL